MRNAPAILIAPAGRRFRGLAAFLLPLIVWCAVGSLGADSGKPAETGDAPLAPRTVRVLLFDSKEGCRVRVTGAYRMSSADGGAQAKGIDLPWTRIQAEDGLTVGATRLDTTGATLIAPDGGTIHVAEMRDGQFLPDHQYAGSMEFTSLPDGGLRVLNRVDVESYVAGVVPNEVWADFHDESLKGQSIAARGYVLFLMSQRADRPFDVRATEGDQVYRGLRMDELGQRASAAVAATRGLIVSHTTEDGERAFCTYYSAACGGMSQSIADIQPGDAPAPLCGGVRCEYCAIAIGEAYRWGPTEISKADLLTEMKSRYGALEEWTRIESVTVSRSATGGRIGEVTIVGDRGEPLVLLGERFRQAVGGRVMRSTACALVDAGDRIRFENGRGFGHGVGLCQWGMEGQARAGKRAGEILGFYYPGSNITRAY